MSADLAFYIARTLAAIPIGIAEGLLIRTQRLDRVIWR